MKRQIGLLNIEIRNLEFNYEFISVLFVGSQERFERDNLHLKFTSACYRLREMNVILDQV